MSFVLYCVLSNSVELPPIVTGVEEAPVEAREIGSLRVLFSRVGTLPSEPPALAQEAMRFQSVIQQAFGAGVLIPFRFPTIVESEAEILEHVDSHKDKYVQALQRLEGKAQLEVKIAQGGLRTSAPEPQTGTEYLKTRQMESAPKRELSQEVRDAAGNDALGCVERESGGVLRLYVLIEHANAAEVKRRISHLKPKAGLRAVVSGPWPPSEFIDGDSQ